MWTSQGSIPEPFSLCHWVVPTSLQQLIRWSWHVYYVLSCVYFSEVYQIIIVAKQIFSQKFQIVPNEKKSCFWKIDFSGLGRSFSELGPVLSTIPHWQRNSKSINMSNVIGIWRRVDLQTLLFVSMSGNHYTTIADQIDLSCVLCIVLCYFSEVYHKISPRFRCLLTSAAFLDIIEFFLPSFLHSSSSLNSWVYVADKT